MVMYHFFSKLTATVVLTSLLILTAALPVVSQAQEAAEEGLSCPLQSAISAWFPDSEDTLTIGDNFSAQARVVNNSSYTLSGIRIGVAVVDSSTQTLSHWSVLSDQYQIVPSTTLEIPIELDISALRAGNYNLRIYAVQGDNTALLGHMINEENQKKIGEAKIIKTTVRGNEVPVSVDVNGNVFKGQPIKVEAGEPIVSKIVTKNDNKVPLLESKMLAVLTEGKVPLGTAVRSDKLDSVKLIPNGTRTTELTSSFVGGGEYTLYAALLTKGSLQPVTKVPIILPGEGASTWSYISHVGLSDYPLQSDSEVVACVGLVGDQQGDGRFTEELGLNFELQRGESILAQKTIYTTDVNTNNYVSYSPGVAAKEFTLVVDLLQLRSNVKYVDSEESSLEEVMRGSMEKVDSVTQSFVCDNSEICDVNELVIGDDLEKNMSGTQKPFWFYAAVVIAALLLMYLMLRRLPPESELSGKSNKLSNDELQ